MTINANILRFIPVLAGISAFVFGADARADGLADEYLCRAEVDDGKLVYFLSPVDVSSREDAIAWGEWVQRTFPAYANKMIPKWAEDDSFPVKLALDGIDGLIRANDNAVNDDGNIRFSLVSRPENGSVSLNLEPSSVRGGFSPDVCATSVWILSWGQLSNRWETLSRERGGIARLLSEMDALEKSGRYGIEGGTAWKDRVAAFRRKRVSWPMWGITNTMDTAVVIHLRCETGQGDFHHDVEIAPYALQPVTTDDNIYIESIGASYEVRATAEGYEPGMKHVVISRGDSEVITEIRLKRKPPKTAAQPRPAPTASAAQPQPHQPAQPRPAPTASAAQPQPHQPAQPRPAPTAPAAQPQPAVSDSSSRTDSASDAKKATEPSVPEWPHQIEKIIELCSRKYYTRYWMNSSTNRRDDEDFIRKSARLDAVEGAIRHLKSCPGCEKCRDYHVEKTAGIPDDDIFIQMIYVQFLKTYPHQKQLSVERVRRDVRMLLKSDLGNEKPAR